MCTHDISLLIYITFFFIDNFIHAFLLTYPLDVKIITVNDVHERNKFQPCYYSCTKTVIHKY